MMRLLARIFGKKLEYLDHDILVTEYHFLNEVYIASQIDITKNK